MASLCAPIAGTGTKVGRRAIADRRRRDDRSWPVLSFHRHTPKRRMGREIGNGVHEAEGRARLPQLRGGLLARHRREHRSHEAVDLRAIGDARGIALVAGFLRQHHISEDNATEIRPFALVLDRDQHQRAVGQRERAIGADRGMREADALGRAPGAFGIKKRHIHPVRHAGEQAGLHGRSLARDAPRDQCLQHARVGGHAAGDVADRDADAARPRRMAGDRGKPAFRLHQQVIGLHVRIGIARAVAGDVDRDQPLVFLAQRL